MKVSSINSLWGRFHARHPLCLASVHLVYTKIPISVRDAVWCSLPKWDSQTEGRAQCFPSLSRVQVVFTGCILIFLMVDTFISDCLLLCDLFCWIAFSPGNSLRTFSWLVRGWRGGRGALSVRISGAPSWAESIESTTFTASSTWKDGVFITDNPASLWTGGFLQRLTTWIYGKYLGLKRFL